MPPAKKHVVKRQKTVSYRALRLPWESKSKNTGSYRPNPDLLDQIASNYEVEQQKIRQLNALERLEEK